MVDTPEVPQGDEQPVGEAVEEAVAGDQELGKEQRTWGMLCHLLALAGFLGIPLGNIIGPLVVWLLKREEGAFIDRQGKESLNFQISMTIYGFVAALLVLVIIGIPLLIALLVFDVVMVVVASVRVNKGEDFHYPLCIRFIK